MEGSCSAQTAQIRAARQMLGGVQDLDRDDPTFGIEIEHDPGPYFLTFDYWGIREAHVECIDLCIIVCFHRCRPRSRKSVMIR
jgi:hypothetical protein